MFILSMVTFFSGVKAHQQPRSLGNFPALSVGGRPHFNLFYLTVQTNNHCKPTMYVIHYNQIFTNKCHNQPKNPKHEKVGLRIINKTIKFFSTHLPHYFRSSNSLT